TDQAGAVILKASVTAHNELTNQDLKTVTTSTGDFTFTNLRPGIYDVSASAAGFDTTNETAIHLQLEATVTVRLVLRPGQATESVTVHANEVQLDQTHADRGEVYSTDEIENAPLNSGNPMLIINTEPGVYFNGCVSCGWVRPFDNGAINQFSTNGQGSDTNDFQLDGSPNNANSFGSRDIGYVPPTASVQEMKFVSNPYDAQYGHTGGGIFDIVTKYGTNTLHGQVYENARRTWLDANTHTNDALNLPKTSDQRDQRGFEVDGPVIIPHLYNGRDKTFFEMQLELYNQNTPWSGVDDVPPLSPGSTTQTVAQTGDFSGAYYWNGNAEQQINFYDPTTATGANGTRTQFAGNKLTGMNANAQKLLSYLPLPNRASPSNESWGIDNYAWQRTETDRFDNVVARLDHNFGANDRTYLRFAWNKRFQNVGDDYNGIPGAAASGVFPLTRQNHFFTADWQHTFSPNSLFDVHASYTRYAYNQNQGPTPFDLSQVGLSGLSVAGITPSFPQIGISGVTTFGNNASNGGNKLSISNTVAAMPMWTYVLGAHTIKAGLDYRWMRASNFTQGASSGAFNVGNDWTRMNAFDSQTENTQGLGLASFLLGTMDGGHIDINANSYFSYPYFAPFIQDDWKVSHKLTVNLGVRWDLQGPPSEANNKMLGDLDTTTPNPVMSEITATLPNGTGLAGGLTFAGINGQPRTLFNWDFAAVQPRVGFAYSLDKKTVIRGGIGSTFMQFAGQGYNNGFSQSTNYVGSTNGGYTPNGNTLTNPIPTIAKPVGSALGLMSQLGDTVSISNRNFKIPGVVNYSLGAERQLSAHTTVDLSYVGSTGYHQDSWDDINHMNADFVSHCNLEMGASITTFNNCNNQGANPEWVANPFQGVDGFSTVHTGNGNGYYTNSLLSAGNFTRPLPQFGEIYQNQNNDGKTEFDSLQAVVTHRWSDALTAHGSFVWAKTMDSGGIIDPVYRIRAHYVDFGNRKWRYTANAVWHIPVGKNRKLLGNSNRILDGAVGNWVIGAIYYYQAGTHSNVGFPYQNPSICGEAFCNWVEVVHPQHYGVHRVVRNGTSLIAGSSTCVGYYDGNGNLQPEGYAVCPKATPTAREDFDFIQRPANWEAFQNVSDSGVYNPRGQQLDMSMSKSFPVWQQTKLEVRFEGYDVLNHPSWDGEGYWWAPWDPNFGTINMTYNNQTNAPRQVQLSAKVTW
ncbi:MAG: carboxypeptidase regulatory-like domain-containing protein, partial [Terracidiphilus sp.]